MAPLFQQPFMSGGFPSMNRAAAGPVGGWVELGRASAGAGVDDFTVSSLADKRYYMVLFSNPTAAAGNLVSSSHRFNADSGSNYALRYQANGATDATATSQTFAPYIFANSSSPNFSVSYIANRSANEKLVINHAVGQNTAGAANAPERWENVGKWANTSDPIDEIGAHNSNTGSFNTTDEIVVLGWDPADTHSNNFWEELADASWSSGGSISSGTFTAKKYLWIQGWHTNDSNATGYATLRVGNTTVDTGSNYANRYNQNASSENTGTSENVAYIYGSNTNASSMTGFFNTFIINNASNEKLMINHYVARGASGAANAPDRWESVHKWANTSNQIDIVELLRSSNNFTAGQIKVWGAN